jgi:cell division septal protein FtsQ
VSLVAAPADKRFRRVHVKPARRRGWLRGVLAPALRYGGIAALIAVAAYEIGALVSRAGVLRVDRIAIAGNERLSSGDVLALLTGMRGEHILLTDLPGWRQRIMASPWVRDAALKRSLPATIEVTVFERTPVGIGRLDGRLYLFDEHGTVIDEYGAQYADLDLPIVDGLAASTTEGTADESRAELAARVIAAVRGQPAVASRLSQIDVSDVRNAAVILSGEPAVIYVGEDRFSQRLQAYLDLSETLHARVPEIDYIDLRFDGRIFVRPSEKVAKRK